MVFFIKKWSFQKQGIIEILEAPKLVKNSSNQNIRLKLVTFVTGNLFALLRLEFGIMGPGK
jgi:hypothetical protein